MISKSDIFFKKNTGYFLLKNVQMDLLVATNQKTRAFYGHIFLKIKSNSLVICNGKDQNRFFNEMDLYIEFMDICMYENLHHSLLCSYVM